MRDKWSASMTPAALSREVLWWPENGAVQKKEISYLTIFGINHKILQRS